MGQQISPNIALLRQSYKSFNGQPQGKALLYLQLSEEERQQQALGYIEQFLDVTLTEAQLRALKRYLQNMKTKNFTFYVDWLIKQANQKFLNFTNIVLILKIIREFNGPFRPTLQLITECQYRKHYHLGKDYYQEQQFQKSLHQFQRASKIFPQLIGPTYSIGLCLVQLNRPDEAVGYFLRATKLDPGYENSYRKVIEIYSEKDNDEKVDEYWKLLLQIKPRSVRNIEEYLFFLRKKQMYQDQLRYYRILIEIQSLKTHYYVNLVNILNKLGMLSQAEEQLFKLINGEVILNFDYWLIGDWLIDQKKYKEALQILDKALKNEQSAKVNYSIAKVYLAKHHIEQAFEYYEKALRLDPTYSLAYQDIAHYFSQDKDLLAESIQFYQQQLKYDPNNIQIYYDMGRQQHEKGNTTQSIRLYKKALELNPNQVYSYVLLASIKNNLEEYSDALNYLQIAVQLDPDNASIYNLIGNAFCGLAKMAQAKESYKKSIAIDDEFYSSYYNLGLTYFNEYNYQQAKTYLQKSITLKPSFIYAFQLLSNIFIKLNQKEKALQFMQDILIQHQTNSEYFFQLGLLQVRFQKYQEGKKNFMLAYQLDQSNRAAAFNIGYVQVILGNYQEGEKFMLKLDDKRNNQRAYLQSYGECLFKLQRYEESLQLFIKSLHKFRSFEASFCIGKILSKTNKIQEQRPSILEIINYNANQIEKWNCLAYLYRGFHQYGQFFFYFNQICEKLKGELSQNEKQGRTNMSKFIRSSVDGLTNLLIMYKQFDFTVLLGILYRDVGDIFQAKYYFNKLLINYSSSEHKSSLAQQFKYIYAGYIQQNMLQNQDYYQFLVQFIFQQIIQVDFNAGIEIFQYLRQKGVMNDSITNIIYHKRQDAFDRIRRLIQIISQNNSPWLEILFNNQYTVQKVKPQILLSKIISKASKYPNRIEIKLLFGLALRVQRSTSNEIAFYEKDLLELEQKINRQLEELSAQKKNLEQNELKMELKPYLQGFITQQLSNYIGKHIVNQLVAVIFDELCIFLEIEPHLCDYIKQILHQFKSNSIDLSQVFCEISGIFQKRSHIKLKQPRTIIIGKDNKIISLESSVLYDNYEYLKIISTAVTQRQQFEADNQSKLAKEFAQPKKCINSKSLIYQSGKQPYQNENIFQKQLIKPRQNSQIHMKKQGIARQTEIESKIYKSQIIEHQYDESQFL